MKTKFLFFLLIIKVFSCYALEFGINGTELWKDNSGVAKNFCIYFGENYETQTQSIKSKIEFNNISSTLEYLSGNLFVGNFNFSYENQNLKSVSTFFVPKLDDFFLDVQGKHFLFNDSIRFLGGYEKITFKLENFLISPYGIYFSVPETSGEFYWFNGKIGSPKVWAAGLCAEFGNNQFDIMYGAMKLKALNDNEEPLGKADGSIVFAEYQYEVGVRNLTLIPKMGYAFLQGALDLSLTQENQKYMFFSYVFYNCQGDFTGHCITFGLDLDISKNNFHFFTNTVGGFFINQSGNGYTDWQYKNNLLFDGSSGSESYKFNNLTKKGFILIDTKMSYDIKITSKQWEIFVAKLFVVPIFLEKKSSGKTFDSKVMKSWIKSGITIGMEIKL